MSKFFEEEAVSWKSVFVLPSKFDDYKTTFLSFGLSDSPVCVHCTVLNHPTFVSGGRTPRAHFDVTDGKIVARVTFFGSAFQLRKQPPVVGSRILLYGKISTWNGYFQIDHPYIVPPHEAGRVVARYRGQGDTFTESVHAALTHDMPAIRAHFLSLFPGQSEIDILARANSSFFFGFDRLLEGLHLPESTEVALEAQAVARRLAALEVLLRGRRTQVGLVRPESAIVPAPDAITALVARLPFALTGDQQCALQQLLAALAEQRPMDALLSGDVGTGKTAVFGVLAAAFWQLGRQVTILTPNELLAQQIAREFGQWWPEVKTRLVTGSSKTKLADAHEILIGTTALLARSRQHAPVPDLLVVDEQQKFSEQQRSQLAGPCTNQLEATATCIPRSAALVAFAGKTLCTLRQSPVEKHVTSRIVQRGDARALLTELQAIITAGKQIAVVYPTITEGVRGLKDWTRATERWERFAPGRVATLNGRMSAEEKRAAIDNLASRKKDVLVTTSAIEVGLTLPDLGALVVVHPEQFGVSQLHQLRGRVARQGGAGLFALYLPDDVDAATLSRLKLLEQIRDGFTLAEHDLELRGFGDLEANGRQHGQGLSHLFPGLRLRPSDIRAAQEIEQAGNEFMVNRVR